MVPAQRLSSLFTLGHFLDSVLFAEVLFANNINTYWRTRSLPIPSRHIFFAFRATCFEFQWAALDPLGYPVGKTWKNLQNVDATCLQAPGVLYRQGVDNSQASAYLSRQRVDAPWCASDSDCKTGTLVLMGEWLSSDRFLRLECKFDEHSAQFMEVWGTFLGVPSGFVHLLYNMFFLLSIILNMSIYIYIHNIYIYIFYSWAGSPVPGLVFGSQGPSVLEQSLQHLNVWSPMGPMLALLVGPKWHLRWFVWDWCQTCHMFESKCSEDIYVHGHWCQCLRTDWDARFLGRA